MSRGGGGEGAPEDVSDRRGLLALRILFSLLFSISASGRVIVKGRSAQVPFITEMICKLQSCLQRK